MFFFSFCFARGQAKNKCGGVIVHVHCTFYIIYFLLLFLNKTLLFNAFSCSVVCSVINKENGEIDRCIQLNSNNSKDQANQGDQFKSKGFRSYFIWNLDISDKIISSNFKEKIDCLKTLLVSLKILSILEDKLKI